jgi:hypothetical protein
LDCFAPTAKSGRVDQRWFAACLFDFIRDPVPIPDTFQRYGCAFRKLAQELPTSSLPGELENSNQGKKASILDAK